MDGAGSSSKSLSDTISRAPLNSTKSWHWSSKKARFIASTITSAKRPCKIYWSFVLPTAFGNLSGTVSMSTTFKSPMPKRSESRYLGVITKEPGVDPNSSTETFAALKLQIDNWRWADVPFYIRSGKRLQERVTEIAIQFKQVPRQLFSDADAPVEPNVLVIRIQPNEGITLRFSVKF